MLLVDCISALGAFAKTSVLQRDGIHLSPLGHRVVGEAIAIAIASDVQNPKAFGTLTEKQEAGTDAL
jgi:lysophospholipase L1-like esterase